jgi:holo-ACP synthase
MSFDRLQCEILASRDARETALAQVLAQALGQNTVVFVSTALPGPCKTLPGADALFGWGLAELASRFGNIKTWVRNQDVLGSYAILEIPELANNVKQACIAIEDSKPVARLLDLDIYDVKGRRLSRSMFGEPLRTCLLCDQPAVDCIRLHRHSLDKVTDHAQHLLAGLLDPKPR